MAMAMASTSQLQSLLRFLTQDAKVPLATAMAKAKDLQRENLIDPNSISKVPLSALQTVFPDEKIAKQIHNASKRVSNNNKKRALSSSTTSGAPSTSASKRRATSPSATASSPQAPSDLEASLTLPTTDASEAELRETVLVTNRAPVVLAFAVTVLKYTMPDQPISSRLSLAQAVVSANSRGKAVSIGIENGKSAEEEGWGAGQPVVKVLGRDVRCLRRWGYEWKEQKNGEQQEQQQQQQQQLEPALWGLDLEALRSSNTTTTSSVASAVSTTRPHQNRSHPAATMTAGLPIYTPQSARAYLLRSFTAPEPKKSSSPSPPPKKKSAAVLTAEKEQNAALLLKALDMLYESWAGTLGPEDLDRRAWNWYVHVRPDVKSGVEGWGERSVLRLGDILKLRRTLE